MPGDRGFKSLSPSGSGAPLTGQPPGLAGRRPFLRGLLTAHNGRVSDNVMAPCPKCGNTNGVHTVGELAAMAQAQLGQANMMAQQAQAPNQGPPGQGWMAEPVAGPPPGPDGYQPFGGRQGWQNQQYNNYGGFAGNNVPDSVEDLIAGAAMGAAGRFIGNAIGRKMQQAYTQKLQPNLQARAQQQIAIAQKYPELRMCQTDQVIFLDGGNRYLPWSAIGNDFSMEHADQVVAQLRG